MHYLHPAKKYTNVNKQTNKISIISFHNTFPAIITSFSFHDTNIKNTKGMTFTLITNSEEGGMQGIEPPTSWLIVPQVLNCKEN